MLKIIHAGLHTSVQDAGRHHLRHLGISQSGALDMPALSIANLLVGNAMSEAGLEITLGKFAATFTSSCWIALTGADSHAELDGKPIWTGWRFHVKAGQTLRLRMPRRGMRSYLAISGGLGLPDVLGSLSTDLKAGFGGYLGRPLRDGDTLPLKKAAYRKPHKPVGIKQILFSNRVRVLPGPEYHEFSEEARDTFWRTGWQLSPQSNRMGYRLQGPALARITPRELFSHGVLPGGDSGAAQWSTDLVAGRCADHRWLPTYCLCN